MLLVSPAERPSPRGQVSALRMVGCGFSVQAGDTRDLKKKKNHPLPPSLALIILGVGLQGLAQPMIPRGDRVLFNAPSGNG